MAAVMISNMINAVEAEEDMLEEFNLHPTDVQANIHIVALDAAARHNLLSKKHEVLESRMADVEAKQKFQQVLDAEMKKNDRKLQGLLLLLAVVLGFGTLLFSSVCIDRDYGLEDLPCVERWDASEALYFCVTTLTTIGYGDYSPKTWFAKCYLILYALVGLGTITYGINVSIEVWISNDAMREKAKSLRAEAIQKCKTFTYYFVAVLLVMGISTSVLTSSEGWTAHDAFYFSWYTAVLIGYGDMSSFYDVDNTCYTEVTQARVDCHGNSYNVTTCIRSKFNSSSPYYYGATICTPVILAGESHETCHIGMGNGTRWRVLVLIVASLAISTVWVKTTIDLMVASSRYATELSAQASKRMALEAKHLADRASIRASIMMTDVRRAVSIDGHLGDDEDGEGSVLHVTLLGARGLKAMTTIGTSEIPDPYATVAIKRQHGALHGDRRFRTRTIQDSAKPRWGEQKKEADTSKKAAEEASKKDDAASSSSSSTTTTTTTEKKMANGDGDGDGGGGAAFPSLGPDTKGGQEDGDDDDTVHEENGVFVFKHVVLGDVIKIRMYDEDAFSTDDHLGRLDLIVGIDIMVDGDEAAAWHPIHMKKEDPGGSRSGEVELEWRLVAGPAMLAAAANAAKEEHGKGNGHKHVAPSKIAPANGSKPTSKDDVVVEIQGDKEESKQAQAQAGDGDNKKDALKKKREALRRKKSRATLAAGAKIVKAHARQSIQLAELSVRAKKRRKRRARRWRGRVRAFVTLIVYILLGATIWTQLEPSWSFTGAAYFVVVTMSTVGWGDETPSTPWNKGFAMFWGTIGLGVFAWNLTALRGMTDPILHRLTNAFRRRVRRCVGLKRDPRFMTKLEKKRNQAARRIQSMQRSQQARGQLKKRATAAADFDSARRRMEAVIREERRQQRPKNGSPKAGDGDEAKQSNSSAEEELYVRKEALRRLASKSHLSSSRSTGMINSHARQQLSESKMQQQTRPPFLGMNSGTKAAAIEEKKKPKEKLRGFERCPCECKPRIIRVSFLVLGLSLLALAITAMNTQASSPEFCPNSNLSGEHFAQQFYFPIVTLTTIGYGDSSCHAEGTEESCTYGYAYPGRESARIAAIFYIILGMTFMVMLQDAISGIVIERTEEHLLKLHKKQQALLHRSAAAQMRKEMAAKAKASKR